MCHCVGDNLAGDRRCFFANLRPCQQIAWYIKRDNDRNLHYTALASVTFAAKKLGYVTIIIVQIVNTQNETGECFLSIIY